MIYRRALITGHEGFVGRHFWRRLSRDGWTLDGCDIVHGPGDDCRDFFARIDRRYDLVIHCAAVVGGRATIEGQPMAVATDLAIDADLWQWALRTRPGRVVYFSSSAAYPIDLQNPPPPWTYETTHEWATRPFQAALHESTLNLSEIRQPDQTYGLAKLVGEIQAEHVRADGVPVTVVRPFSGYGPGQSLDYPMPSFIDRAANRCDPFDIWGDGRQVRDWIHIDDIVDAVMVMVDGGIDGPVNLSTGRGISFGDLALLVCRLEGYHPNFRTHPDLPSGVQYRVGSPALLHSFYEPKISLEDGVSRLLARAKVGA